MVDAVTCFLRCPKLMGAEDYNYWRASVIERLKLAALHDAVFGDEDDETKRKLAASLIKLNIGAEALLIAEQTTDARELMNKLEAKYVTKTIAVQIERQVELLTRKPSPEETTQELLAWLEAHYAKTFQLDATDYNAAQRLGHMLDPKRREHIRRHHRGTEKYIKRPARLGNHSSASGRCPTANSNNGTNRTCNNANAP